MISQRPKNKNTFPLKFESVAGAAIKGENSLDAAIRDVKKGVEIDLIPSTGKSVYSEVRKIIDELSFNDIKDVWLVNYDCDANLKNATTDEAEYVKWVTVNEIYKLHNSGKMVSTGTETFDKIVSFASLNF